MKRDMELIRLLLVYEETGEAPTELANYPDEQKLYQLQLMEDTNLIVAHFTLGNQGRVVAAYPQRLTWAGHDFLGPHATAKFGRRRRSMLSSRAFLGRSRRFWSF